MGPPGSYRAPAAAAAAWAFTLGNDEQQLEAAAREVHDRLESLQIGGDHFRTAVQLALIESLTNALYHGNLEIGSDCRGDDLKRFLALADDRRRRDPYKNRRIHLGVRLTDADITLTIRDEGPGFNPLLVPDLPAPDSPSGRGLLLIRSCTDHVAFNPRGNEVTITKRLP